MRVGLMGGTFDPIHNAHLHIADVARKALSLDRVFFIPVGNPPHKSLNASTEDRLRMAELAARDIPWAEVLDIEAKRSGMTYTVDTLAELTTKRPGDTFYYIVGTDALRDMPLWRNAKKAMEMCELIAVARPGYDLNALMLAKADAEEKTGAVVHIVDDDEGFLLSSTQVRETAAAGGDTGGMVPHSLAAYIKGKGLYRSELAK